MAHFNNKIRLDEVVEKKLAAIPVSIHSSVEEVASLFARKNIRSAPVWDEEEGRFVSFIDEVDLLEYAVVHAHRMLTRESLDVSRLEVGQLSAKYGHFTPEEIDSLNFGGGTVETILRLPGSERRKMFVFQSNAMLTNAMSIIKDHERVLVQHVDNPRGSKAKLFVGRLMNKLHRSATYKICSQTDILRFIAEHAREEESLRNIRTASCADNKPVTYITVNDRALDGFLKMLEQGTEACAVVDVNGVLVGTLCASDLRGMTDGKLRAILLPVMEFFQQMVGSKGAPPLTCLPDDPLIETTKKILRSSTRRCWMVDEQFRPISLVPMGRIIVAVLENPCDHL
eukprot:TRINITY_DN11625_c0_g1_i1.p1 TRINITY_DN11625_c0_g1~~TRINITY_DN11625_c0_g1_i1.p1  ORF type:complete len:363 (+),score=107.45 TRINITY_DN11625_c0_g1_i1:67-1089(+)